MKHSKILILMLALIAALSGCIALDPSAGGAEYPAKPVTMMVPFRAGGGTDTQARVVAAVLEEKLGQPVNVVNNPGAGGTVGVQEMLATEADGYTLAFVATVAIVDNPILQELGYGMDDIAVASMLSTFQSALVSAGDVPYEDWDGFVAYAQENPGLKAMFFGASSRAAVEAVAEAEGLEFEYVPGQGGADLGPAILAGDVDIGFSGGIHTRFLETNEMQVLLNMNSTGPLQATPDVPSAFELYGVSVNTHAALVAPAGVPDDVLTALSEASRAASESDTYAEVMANLQYPITYMSAADAQAELNAQAERFAASQE